MAKPDPAKLKRGGGGSALTGAPRAPATGSRATGARILEPESSVPGSRDAKVRSKARLLAKLSKVRPMSAAAQRVLSLTSSDASSSTAIADAISGDPALATETLRIANSAVYRRAYPIDDLRRAVTTLGLDMLHSMATAMALLGTVSSSHPLFDELHASSVVGATLAGLLTTELHEVEKSSAFIAGLLAEMGAMACLMVDDEYAALHRAAAHDPVERDRAELDAYGMTTGEVAGKLLVRNQVPQNIVDAVVLRANLEGVEATPLGRIVVFTRAAAPILCATDEDGTAANLREQLSAYARLAGLEIDLDVLASLCDWAMSSAALIRAPISL